MAQLLVYTKNNFLRLAIDSLTYKERSVTYFNNRVQFLACATILDDAVLLIDSINKNDDSVRWLSFRLDRGKKKRKIHYLVHLSMLSNSFLPSLCLVAEIHHLRTLLFFNCGSTSCKVKKNINEEIDSKLKRMLSCEDYFILKNIYSIKSDGCKGLSRREINKVYYIRKRKLHLNSSSEFKQLIVFLGNNIIMQDKLKI